MLDVQRNRSAKNREEIEFARKFMWAHMIFGAGVMTLFLFHAVFSWFAGSLVWYGLSLVVMYGYMNGRQACRWLLALTFFAGSVAGLYFLSRVLPAITEPRAALVPHAIIPLWVGLANLTYAVAALFVSFSPRIRRAGETGFMLW
ncbi:hypothetical protein [Prosthecobacter sp.]|uniref:hypothetical protein n=1 Tax=Prosthecobacter sp. TaxID=1965333 RepID=UPI002489C8F7|nr:hypothetical protein [Prosthecobacter sp.]MDI1315176.1 hypothetical protein [Prosthecobacter sp.]